MEGLIQSIPPFLIFLPMFVLIYTIGYFFVFQAWPSKSRPEAASCFISLFHGSPAAILAFLSILPYNRYGFASANTPFQNVVLEFSIAYFTMDLIYYLIFNPSDVLFIGHHLATLFVFLTCRYIVYHGAVSVLGLLFLAEVTSLMQNIWTLANIRRFEVEFAAKVHSLLSLPFYVLYTIVRGFVGPFFVYKMGAFYLGGGADGVIPCWVWVSWIGVVVTAISVSILWVWNLWVDLFRERYRGFGKKLQ